jgi:flagellar basal body rod protein FlgC
VDRIEATMQAIENEIDNMETGDVMPPVHYKDILVDYGEKIVNTHMFLKDKFKADGAFDKTKARMVYDGSNQDYDEVGDTASPTVNPIAIMTKMNYAASHPEVVISLIDFDYALLLQAVQEGKHVYIRKPKEVVAIWINKRYPYRAKYVNKSGFMYCKLKHYLYGMQEASKQLMICWMNS